MKSSLISVIRSRYFLNNKHDGCVLPPAKSPWGLAAVEPACSLTDVMSEQLARQLENEEGGFPSLAEWVFIMEGEGETTTTGSAEEMHAITKMNTWLMLSRRWVLLKS